MNEGQLHTRNHVDLLRNVSVEDAKKCYDKLLAKELANTPANQPKDGRNYAELKTELARIKHQLQFHEHKADVYRTESDQDLDKVEEIENAIRMLENVKPHPGQTVQPSQVRAQLEDLRLTLVARKRDYESSWGAFERHERLAANAQKQRSQFPMKRFKELQETEEALDNARVAGVRR